MDLLERRNWMGLLARANPERLGDLLGDLPEHSFARAPEIGTVMVQGRTGGTGAPFNIGEITVTRCTLRLASGTIGHSCVQGRNKTHATCAAIVDALMQDTPARFMERILTPLANDASQSASLRHAKAEATKVEFFTLVRGED
ncbi:phosphonate C-P lyase system protein PhnG [Falsirhodobacter sp. alg1]|uniref:phosphonate C-P lyase system protein PhnG n=1 Tax=Falsirhodobacter sp. alg1 TaxID=1472418 RepID=UPI0009E95389|nr:phosphonate C-P lyase system protein PhnG [Falsirhodobacter sp. alg1]